MSRTLQTAASFAIVLVMYWVYAALAVPLIEPSVDSSERRAASSAEIDGAAAQSQRKLEELAYYFPPGSWELGNPKVLQSDEIKLLVGQYTTQDDGRQVRLWPCTIVLTPGRLDDPPEERRRRAIVLQAPEALLRFDTPFDLSRARVGQLVDGRLVGEITIRGAGRPNDPSDDLSIVTRDVQLSQQHVWTPHPVVFRLGGHFGQGREMHMRLASPDPATGGFARGPRIGGLESFTLVHVDRLHLELPPEKGVTDAGQAPRTAAAPSKASVPVDVACQGPFVFDVLKQEAMFEDRVKVIRGYPDGPDDSLVGDKLIVHLAPRAARAKPNSPPAAAVANQKSPKPGLSDLEPVRLEAQGRPVIIESPREDAYARGEQIEYDLITGRIFLKGRQTVFLRQGVNQCEAPEVEYQPPAKGHAVGQIAAAGPGWFRGQMDNRSNQQLEAHWNRELRLQPDKENPRDHVLSLTGGATLDYGGIGHLAGGEIHFYINERPAPKATDPPQVTPDRMLATTDVKLDSPQLSGAVDELNVWFKPDPTAPGGYQTRIEPSGGADRTSASPAAADSPVPNPNVSNPAVPNPNISDPTVLPPATAPREPTNHYHLTGRLLQVQIVIGREKTEVSNLTVLDQVHLIETRTKQPNEKPVVITGDRIEVINASSPYAAISIAGRPARFDGRGLGLAGANINVNRGTNELKIEGLGSMDLPPLERDVMGHSTRDGGPMRVDWQGGMKFDGRTAQFEKSVVATSALQRLQTETLKATFRQMIYFGEMDQSDEPQWEQIRCQGGVRMDSRSLDESGQPLSVERMETNDLVINNLTGELSAAGPGWLQSWRLGAGPMVEIPGLGRPPDATAQPTADAPHPPADELTYLYVQFLSSITGNVHRREITFHDRVLAVSGPVPNWQSMLPDDDPDALGPRGAQLTCGRLGVVEMPSPTGGRNAFEMTAMDNARIEGPEFTAWGDRITYDQRKELLILKGDGRTDASLFYQASPRESARKVSGKEFFYWLRTQKLGGEFQSFDAEQ